MMLTSGYLHKRTVRSLKLTIAVRAPADDRIAQSDRTRMPVPDGYLPIFTIPSTKSVAPVSDRSTQGDCTGMKVISDYLPKLTVGSIKGPNTNINIKIMVRTPTGYRVVKTDSTRMTNTGRNLLILTDRSICLTRAIKPQQVIVSSKSIAHE